MLMQVVRSIVQMGDEESITAREGREDIVAGAGKNHDLTEQFDDVQASSGSSQGRFEDMAVC